MRELLRKTAVVVAGFSLLAACRPASGTDMTGAAPFDERAIVVAVASTPDGVRMGCGFVFGYGSLAATAWHLVADVSEGGGHVMLISPTVISAHTGDMYETRILAADREADVALLGLPISAHPALQLADDEQLLTADEAVVCAYPGPDAGLPWNVVDLSAERLPVGFVAMKAGRPLSLELGPAQEVGPGWSGAPIVLADTGRVAGLFTSLHYSGRTEEDWRAGRPWGCSAGVIAELAEGIAGADRPTGAAVEVTPEDARRAFDAALLGVRAYAMDKSAEALDRARDLVRLRPASARAHTLLAAVLLGAGESEAAEEQYRKALRLDPDGYGAHFVYGNFLSDAGRMEEARAEHERCMEIDPANPLAVVNMLQLLTEAGEVEAADALSERAVAAHPANAYVWGSRAIALQSRGDVAGTIRALTRAVDLKPEVGPWRGFLAKLLTQAGRIDEADGHYAKLLEIEPDNPVVWFWRAEFLAAHRPGQADEALAALDRCEQLNASGVIPHDEIAALRAKLSEGQPPVE